MEPQDIQLRIWYRSLTPDQREFFDERAGIIEYEAGAPRGEAERQAAVLVAEHYRILPPIHV